MLAEITRRLGRIYAAEGEYKAKEVIAAIENAFAAALGGAADRRAASQACIQAQARAIEDDQTRQRSAWRNAPRAKHGEPMPINILMPALSPTMEKGNLAKWLKKEGDTVKPGDILAEIETDKATMEYEAVDEGMLAKIVVPEGTADVPVNQLIAVLAGEGEDVKAAAAGAAKGAVSPSPQRGEGAARSAPGEGSSAQAGSPAPAAATATTPSAPHPSPLPNGEREQPVPRAHQRSGAGHARNGHGRIFSSPLARRLAKEAGIDLAASRARDRMAASSRATSTQAEAGGGPEGARGRRAGPPPLPRRRRRTTRSARCSSPAPTRSCRTTTCARSSPSAWCWRSRRSRISISPSPARSTSCWRRARRSTSTAPKGEDGKPAWKLSVNDFVIKALALALIKVPEANVTWTESGMLKHKHADIGVAVSIPGGLITPVVRKAETKSLTAISAEMKDFAARARARKLKPEEYQGGSTAVSNLGMYGIEEFAAVINPPHATILAVGAGEQRAVVRDGKIVVATQMKVTLSTDHRAVDGALGAELIGAFKTYIESPTAMLV